MTDPIDPDRIYNGLFLCTGNSARSILGEALMNRMGAGRFRAYSVGSQPKGDVHPMGLSVLQGLGHDTSGLRSKSWSEFAAPDAPYFDSIFTVCENAAGESCPVWPAAYRHSADPLLRCPVHHQFLHGQDDCQ